MIGVDLIEDPENPGLYCSSSGLIYRKTREGTLASVNVHVNGERANVHWRRVDKPPTRRSYLCIVYRCLYGKLKPGWFVVPYDGNPLNIEKDNLYVAKHRQDWTPERRAAHAAVMKESARKRREVIEATREDREEEVYQRALAILGKTA